MAEETGYNPVDELASLVSETLEQHNGDPIKHAEVILHDAAASAADTLVHLMRFSPNEKLRADSAKYILERTLGKLGDSKNAGDDPLQSLMAEAYAIANPDAPRMPNERS